MTDLYVISALFSTMMVAVMVYLIFSYLNSRRKKSTPNPGVPLGERSDYTPRYPSHVHPVYGYNPVAMGVECNSGFSEGLMIGSALRSRDTAVINETVINETVINETVINDAPSFSGFSGGDSGGGGATSDWGSSDSGSSCDSSSSDSCSSDSGS